ncbi:MAG: aminotransferase class I/II-fold pyridoxal phosphate-dependent enzyme [Cellvibrio sp.]|uniref:aminotransferase class I/II-fold pyridoxal phosphate-dependent enzyme n=1 Tax=Cellvibrio sp. TaxID=1965322 RepID=UPI0027183195|nr:aminotransferase class I/II-fold pyridoxal phosphate-dependent enzyme [Cellvibrio sp.]
MKCACILAAGMGSRLKKYTLDRTKCMVEVGGERLVDHTIRALIAGGVETIFIVVGYCGDDLIRHVTGVFPDLDIRFVQNDVYATTNNIYSLKLALPQLVTFEEVILVESDLWIEESVAVAFVRDVRANVVLVSPFRYWMDGTCVTLDPDGQTITGFVAKSDVHLFSNDNLYKTVNWYKFSGDFLRDIYSHFINAYVDAFGKNAYYEDVLKVIAPASPGFFFSHVIDEKQWMEIDDEEDLSRAELIAAPVEKASRMMTQRFGGYWKYQFIDDLTLLVNPFFPTQGMLDELSNAFKIAMREYPSKHSAIARIASKSLPCEAEQIVLGNGASEIMAALFAELDDRQFVIAPPFFLEYQRLLGIRLDIFDREFPAECLETAVLRMANESTRDIVLVNPNNPTGELCSSRILLEILPALAKQGRRLIVDESFMDFSSADESLLKEKIINENPNLLIIKSFGKSYGVPGVRLGVAVTSDIDLLARIRDRLPIWNISSSAEVFLDLLPRYKKEYQKSLSDIRKERIYFQQALADVGVVFYPSEANFVFFQVAEISGHGFEEFCYMKGLLVKKITGRSGLEGVYYRIAVRTREQNSRVIDVIREYLA